MWGCSAFLFISGMECSKPEVATFLETTIILLFWHAYFPPHSSVPPRSLTEDLVWVHISDPLMLFPPECGQEEEVTSHSNASSYCNHSEKQDTFEQVPKTLISGVVPLYEKRSGKPPQGPVSASSWFLAAIMCILRQAGLCGNSRKFLKGSLSWPFARLRGNFIPPYQGNKEAVSQELGTRGRVDQPLN